MSKKTLGIIIGVNTAVTGAAVTIVGLIVPDKAAIINGIIEVVSGAIDGICLVFMKNIPDKEKEIADKKDTE